MAKMFRHRRSMGKLTEHPSMYSSLLDPSSEHSSDGAASPSSPNSSNRPLRGRAKSSLLDYQSRNWISAVEHQGEKPPPRKLVKDMNGSGRPSFSQSLSDSDGEKEKGLMRRQIARLKSFYKREK
ncbi:hypothetical protein QC762_114545 [Podospora pseudocomata]|uniref:Uncharacterized protein n=4 Tax=Podospora TaxID=5144 RepID=A0ABY6RXX0_PODCO|nr:hypothetical protein QC762_114545 [Podospora pseudocomata]KAK4673732.1 hypothetical protein QC763_114545 [Podospora pseudopauciseta]KAK4682227.1 hypothetical protein QC764_114545 [Podospora pseudoanserina]VBB72943.1 Putative protein of unknown function [Podospora comata]